jgi:hypothetical protein
MKINGKEYITVNEMAIILKVDSNTIKQRLFQHDIKPISKDALYDLSALEVIKAVKMGRPKKQPETSKKANKGKK